MNSNSNLIIVGVICLVIGAAGGYFGRGLMTMSSPTSGARGPFGAIGRQPTGRQGTNANNTPALNSQFGGRTMGTIQSVNGSNMTVKTNDGSSKIILLTSDTKYEKVTSGQASDFPAGTNVVISGQQGSDGNIVATSVQEAQAMPSGMPQRPQDGSRPQGNPAGAQ